MGKFSPALLDLFDVQILAALPVNSSSCTVGSNVKEEKAAISNSNAVFCLCEDIFVCGKLSSTHTHADMGEYVCVLVHAKSLLC
jgi:hypothetical protein